MIALPSFLSLFFAGHQPPAVPKAPTNHTLRRRRAIADLRLSQHLLHDIGMDDQASLANDPRWSRRPDLER